LKERDIGRRKKPWNVYGGVEEKISEKLGNKKKKGLWDTGEKEDSEKKAGGRRSEWFQKRNTRSKGKRNK